MTDIRAISPADYQIWDQYVLTHAAAGAYLTTAWKQAVETGYGRKTFYLGAFENGALVGVLPLVLIKPPLGRKCLVSLPYCDYGGLLAERGELARALIDRAIDLAGELRACLEIRTSEPSSMLEKTAGLVQVTDKCRMVLELPGSAARLWDGFKTKLRTKVNRAIKHGLDHQIGKEELLPDFYRVFSRNMRDLGSPVHSENWLHSVLVAFGDDARVGVVYKDGSPVAAGIILSHGKAVTNPWASALREFNRLRPNTLLYWALLQHASDSGFRFFDFGRSTPGEGTYDFKKQWGAEPAPLHWYRQEKTSAMEGRAETNAPLRTVLERLWKTLPVALANAAGPPIRKHISR
jgi:FemAB-related protein (PEP-CTERM system-associated)